MACVSCRSLRRVDRICPGCGQFADLRNPFKPKPVADVYAARGYTPAPTAPVTTGLAPRPAPSLPAPAGALNLATPTRLPRVNTLSRAQQDILDAANAAFNEGDNKMTPPDGAPVKEPLWKNPWVIGGTILGVGALTAVALRR